MHHVVPAAGALTTALYAAPQVPGDARELFDAALVSAGLDGEPTLPLRATRGHPSALLLAREWGLGDLDERLAIAIEASYEPTWDHSTGEFTWGLGLDEPHPRGQYNAFLAAAEAVGPGRWEALSAGPLPPCPQIVGVDFPDVAFSRAEWVDGGLHARVVARRDDPTRRTTFRVVGAEPRQWDFTGPDRSRVELTSAGLAVTIPMVTCDIELTPGSY